MHNSQKKKKNHAIRNLIWQVDIVWERWSFMHFQQLHVFLEESDKARSRDVKVGCLEGVSVSRRVWSVRQVWADLRGTGVYFIIYSVVAHRIEQQKKEREKDPERLEDMNSNQGAITGLIKEWKWKRDKIFSLKFTYSWNEHVLNSTHGRKINIRPNRNYCKVVQLCDCRWGGHRFFFFPKCWTHHHRCKVQMSLHFRVTLKN